MYYTLYSMYVSVLSVDPSPTMHHEVFFNIRWVYSVYTAFISYAEFRYYYFCICRIFAVVYPVQALKMSTVDITTYFAKVSIRV